MAEIDELKKIVALLEVLVRIHNAEVANLDKYKEVPKGVGS